MHEKDIVDTKSKVDQLEKEIKRLEDEIEQGVGQLELTTVPLEGKTYDDLVKEKEANEKLDSKDRDVWYPDNTN